LLGTSEKRDIKRRETELRQVQRRVAKVEADFAKNLNLLKRDMLNEEEFNKVSLARRDERARLTEPPTPVDPFPKRTYHLKVSRRWHFPAISGPGPGLSSASA